MAPSLEDKLVHLKSLVERGLIDQDMARAEQARLLREELGGGGPTSPAAPEPMDDQPDATIYKEGGDRDLKMARQYIVLSQHDRVHRVRRETPGMVAAVVHGGFEVFFGVDPAGRDLEDARRMWLPGVVAKALEGPLSQARYRSQAVDEWTYWVLEAEVYQTPGVEITKPHPVWPKPSTVMGVFVQQTRPDPSHVHAIGDTWDIDQPWTVRLHNTRDLSSGKFWDLVVSLGRELGYQVELV